MSTKSATPEPLPERHDAASAAHAKIKCYDQADAQSAIDVPRFADTMSNFASTVCVVTASDGSVRLGRTVTASLSLSAHPPSLIVSITNTSELAALIARTKKFSIALLATGQHHVANAFAGVGDPAQRFENGKWSKWTSGNPRLEGSVASIDCTLAGSIEMDTHTLFAGVLVDTDTDPEKSPLLWHRRDYAQLSRS